MPQESKQRQGRAWVKARRRLIGKLESVRHHTKRKRHMRSSQRSCVVNRPERPHEAGLRARLLCSRAFSRLHSTRSRCYSPAAYQRVTTHRPQPMAGCNLTLCAKPSRSKIVSKLGIAGSASTNTSDNLVCRAARRWPSCIAQVVRQDTRCQRHKPATVAPPPIRTAFHTHHTEVV